MPDNAEILAAYKELLGETKREIIDICRTSLEASMLFQSLVNGRGASSENDTNMTYKTFSDVVNTVLSQLPLEAGQREAFSATLTAAILILSPADVREILLDEPVQ